MATLRRLTDSCLHVLTDEAATLIDPGFHTFLESGLDLDPLEVSRVLITHEHGDHAHPDFVRWLVDRGDEVTVHSNQAVADLLGKEGIAVTVDLPAGVSAEDVLHGLTPRGDQPPNRAFTVEGVLTHPGDSREPTSSAPVLALLILVPWDSMAGAMEFARRLAPEYVVGIHDFYLSESGRAWVTGMARTVLEPAGIEVLDLDWGQTATI